MSNQVKPSESTPVLVAYLQAPTSLPGVFGPETTLQLSTPQRPSNIRSMALQRSGMLLLECVVTDAATRTERCISAIVPASNIKLCRLS